VDAALERVIDDRPAIIEPRGRKMHPRLGIDDPFRLDPELLFQER
jgi:hypothetical protein